MVPNLAGAAMVVEDDFVDAADCVARASMVRATGAEAYVFETLAYRWCAGVAQAAVLGGEGEGKGNDLSVRV